MRITHIITGLSTGGAERALYNLLIGGLQSDIKNHVISLSDAGTFGAKIQALDVPVTVLEMRKGKNLIPAIKKLRQAVKRFRPHLIQGWMYHGNIAASYVAKYLQPSTPVIWNIRHSLYDMRKEKYLLRQVIRINRMLSRRANKIIYNSHISQQQHENYGFCANQSIVIPNGFDLEQWKPEPERRIIVRNAFGLNENTKLVGHFARYHPMKDHATFLAAAAEICEKDEDVHFLLAGKGIDKSNPLLTSKINDAMTNRIHLLGERNDIEDLMPALDVFCLSSSWGEAFPNVLGEAMACGIPCVTTDIGDSKAIVNEHGISVNAHDVSAMATAILKLLSRVDYLVLKDSQDCRIHIQKNYSLSKIVERYKNQYSNLC